MVVAGLAFAGLLASIGSYAVHADNAAPAAKPKSKASSAPPAAAPATDNDAKSRPVILLTGFEPFGAGRPPNPSWEGIKSLDGRSWKEYRLVSKQMHCVWGAPAEQLQEWIAEYHPVAIFSFGQGRPGGFAVESQARKLRGQYPDNAGKLPPAPVITTDGPEQFKSTADCAELAKTLSAKGQVVQVSKNPGQYLCEEALYTLEYLKARDKIVASVLFCHVPPLNTQLGGKRVDAPLVQQFVEDLLESWHATAKPVVEVIQNKQAAAPKKEEVEKHIRNYFETWSNQDLEGYEKCFAEKASIQLLTGKAQIETYSLPPFIASQKEAHRRARTPMKEVPISISISFAGRLAKADVFWKLTSGSTTQTGYDHFTLLKTGEKWKIVHLIFYESDKLD